MLSAIAVAAVVVTASPTHEVNFSATAEWSRKFTHHEGTQLRYVYGIAPGIGAFAAWREHWSTGRTEFTDELIETVRESPQAATALMVRRAFLAGLAATPWSGTDGFGRAFTLRLSVGAGWAQTELEVGPSDRSTIFDTGARLTGFGALEFQYRLTDHLILSAALDELVFPSYIDRINGCRFFGTYVDDSGWGQPRQGRYEWESDDAGCSWESMSRTDRITAQQIVDSSANDIRDVRSFSIGVALIF